ncbi:coiled-coil domain-containing protein [Prevotella sp.]|uniref:coiled-coil domain-containing protein n=1 Tax=Prevotella sp. TaxID=59823 RepID=UPI0027E35209|nr:hypothetical protein [Prevotella sp.]
MKRLLIIMLTICVWTNKVCAQFHSMNYDKETVAAMATAFGAEAVAESYYNEQVGAILKHYNAAEVATAGIFASKFLERKALTDLGLWNSSTENYYYRRIYNMVSHKIMPKIWTVAKMMLHSPQTALYWGSYLVKVCDDTKNLCMQFESVVTNSTLTFADIQFLEINREIAAILKLSDIGDVDWKAMLDDLAKVPGNFTMDNMTADIDNLYNMGVGLATSGMTNIGDALLQKSAFKEVFDGRVSKVIDIYENYNDLFEQLDKGVGNTLLSMIGGKDNVARLFNLADYNLTSWMTDYMNEAKGQYYTQRWYIYRRDRGSETLCDYNPPTDDNSILKGDHWYRIDTKDPDFYPNSSKRETILQNSENHAGWSRAKVQQLNNQNDGYTYSISYNLSTYIISSKKKGQKQKAYAYHITVTKSWDREETVYEDVFDSYSMDLNTFKAQLQARLSEQNYNEEGYTYYIGSDTRNYYQATDAAKLKGCESVTISVTCSDGVTLGQGTTQYKCRECGKSLNAHSKECAMKTSVTEGNLDLSELDKMQQEADSKVTMLQAQIGQLETENKELLRKIANASVEDAAVYRQQYNANKTQIDKLNGELTTWQQKQQEIEQAKEEAGRDNDVATDDYYHIPAIMNDCKTAYNLTWQDKGVWNGYVYTRKATVPNINGIVTFKATLSIARKPKYFLAIKIHRAILQIAWELTSEYTNTSVVDVMTLDPNKTEQEKADEVNRRISEIAREYPSCKITTEYAKSDLTAENTSSDIKHLLWSSDRLEIAREVDSRITKIYADLVSLEKMMHYKRSIIDVLKSALPEIDDNMGRRQTILEECYERWINGARGRKEASG